jgi:uncharacterized protein YwqG
MGVFDFLFKKNNEQSSPNNALESIEVQQGLFLPKAFVEYWDEIKKTGLEYIEIKATPANDIKRTESSFGYYPFIPIGFNYPLDKNGNPMIPLAQLNFSEIPHLKNYPTKGILQFYIANDDSYGLDFDNQYNPYSFRVIYIEDIDEAQLNPDTAFLDSIIDSENSPVFKPHRLSFTKKMDYVGMNDCRSNSHGFSVDDWIEQYSGENKNKLEDLSYNLFATNGHKIGGYAYFTQSDPREYIKDSETSILLFQMDTDDEIMWGDAGVANFFINSADLINKDFSRVMYNWDCC